MSHLNINGDHSRIQWGKLHIFRKECVMTVRCFVVFCSTLGWSGGEWCHLVGESRRVRGVMRRKVMTSCMGALRRAGWFSARRPRSPLPMLPALFCVLLTWGLLRLLRLICQNFGQISSLSSANRASLDRARHRRNKSQYAWKTQRIQFVKANNFCSPPLVWSSLLMVIEPRKS